LIEGAGTTEVSNAIVDAAHKSRRVLFSARDIEVEKRTVKVLSSRKRKQRKGRQDRIGFSIKRTNSAGLLSFIGRLGPSINELFKGLTLTFRQGL
jgi:hypothetical protein